MKIKNQNKIGISSVGEVLTRNEMKSFGGGANRCVYKPTCQSGCGWSGIRGNCTKCC
jgi:hypothetical protein